MLLRDKIMLLENKLIAQENMFIAKEKKALAMQQLLMQKVKHLTTVNTWNQTLILNIQEGLGRINPLNVGCGDQSLTGVRQDRKVEEESESVLSDTRETTSNHNKRKRHVDENGVGVGA